MLEIKGVTYSYGCDDAAIKDVSVAVEEGSIVGVVPSRILRTFPTAS